MPSIPCAKRSRLLALQTLILGLGFGLILNFVLSEASARTEEVQKVLQRIDSRVYRPQAEGVSAFTAAVVYPHLNRRISSLTDSEQRIKGRFFWNQGDVKTRFLGVPKNNQNLNGALRASLKSQMTAFFSEPIQGLWKNFKVEKTGARELTATPKSGEPYKGAVEKYVLKYSKDYLIERYESFALDGRTVTTFEYKKVPGKRNLYKVDESDLRIYGKGPVIRIKNKINYKRVGGDHYFPERITTRRYLDDDLIETNRALYTDHKIQS